MAAAMAGGKGKKKWSKGKTRDKVLNKVLFDQETYDRLLNEVPKVRRKERGKKEDRHGEIDEIGDCIRLGGTIENQHRLGP